MSNRKDRAVRSGGKSDGEFFTVGPPLHAIRPGYVQRGADEALFSAVSSGRDAYLFAPERSGKTSLVAAISAQLQNQGFLVATLDLAQIGERDAGTDSGRWYYSIAYRLLRQLRVKIDLQSWWQDKSILSNRQRLFEFFIEVLLANTKKRIVVFIDELQAVEGLPFAQHLIESIKSVSKSRATELDFERLSFVLVGECDPELLGADPARSPFNLMEAVRLQDFSRQNLEIFAAELGLSAEDAAAALDRVFYWTSGQPYLTQKIARAIAKEQVSGDIAGHVDRIVRHQFGSRSAVTNEPHLSHIHRRVLGNKKLYESCLNTYGQVRKGISVFFEPESRAQRTLISLGLLTVTDGLLAVRNRLYGMVFTARWANENLPLHWRGPAVAAGVLFLLTAIPFWYTQLLPKPYARVLTSGTLELETIADAHRNLRSFPGHAETADRLFVYQLRNRAGLAKDEAAISAVTEQAARMPGADGLAENLLADFWDRQTARALREEQRDTALLAALESLVVATPERRRLASALVGQDYPLLTGTVPAHDVERMSFDAENKLLTLVRGAQVQQWGIANGALEQRPPWAVSALEITPLLRRVIVDREGLVNRLSLTVNISHMRLEDLRVRLIAPSGRASELSFDVATSSANEEVRFPARQLQALVGESLSGTWTLSIRDESGGFAGHLVGWRLSLNSQVTEEDFERGLDIPEPVQRESDSIWFSAEGRYAVARSLQSDSARLWDLAYAQPARTIAVPADETVLGLGPDAETLVTVAQSSVNVWDTGTGRRQLDVEVGTTAGLELVGDGQRLLSRSSAELETTFELWDLADGTRTAAVAVAGTPAISALDPTGTVLAVADYDRAVRIWDVVSGELLNQIDLPVQPTQLQIAHGGRTLATVFGAGGLAVWHVDTPTRPLLMRRGRDAWHLSFSQSGGRFIAGSASAGFQVYRSEDGAPLGPALVSGVPVGADMLLELSQDESVVVTGAAGDKARFWRAPADASSAASDVADVSSWRIDYREDLAVRLSPDGRRLAVGDNEGQVNVLDVGAALPSDEEQLNYLGHIGRVSRLVFSPDGALVASAGADGSIRVWDANTGAPRPFRFATQANTIDQLRFSRTKRYLAALIGQRVFVMDTEQGTIVVNRELGEPHSDIEFGADDALYLASESGTLRRLLVDQLGIWTVQSVWQAPFPLRRIRISPNRQMMIIADSRNVVQVFDIARGTIGTARLDLPQPVRDVLFTRSESQVMIRTSRWVHRADISRSGIHWRAAIRAPEAAYDTEMVFDQRDSGGAAAQRDLDSRLLLLTREPGYPQVAELDFSLVAGPVLFGSHLELAREWRAKLIGNE